MVMVTEIDRGDSRNSLLNSSWTEVGMSDFENCRGQKMESD